MRPGNIVENTGEIVILRAFRPLLTLLTVYKWHNFRNKSCGLLMRNICRAIGITILFSSYAVLFLSSELMVCVKEKFDLDVIAQPLSFLLGGCQVQYIYFSILWKSAEVTKVLDRLHEIIKKRNGFSYFFVSFGAKTSFLQSFEKKINGFWLCRIYHRDYCRTMRKTKSDILELLRL